METVSRTQETMEELKARLENLEQQKASLESEISVMVEQIPILELSRYAALLESHTSSLRLVRDMLQSVAEDRFGDLGVESQQAAPTVPST
jgi:predicted  nucleic acid-binding Zn-ribbon protein